jgi:antitoxin component of MazEF toxin-antitoxin module
MRTTLGAGSRRGQGRALQLDAPGARKYGNYMKTMELKVTRIGNSRGVRLPAASLQRYRIGTAVIMEERSDGILLRATGPAVEKLSWEDTARAMATSEEDWLAWDAVQADGLSAVPWDTGKALRVAEGKARYTGRTRGAKRS